MALCIPQFILPMKQMLIIQLTTETMSCALATVKNKTYTIYAIEHFPLVIQEATQTHIANLSRLVKMAKSFTDQYYNGSNANIICFNALTPTPQNTTLFTLQTIMFLSRIGLPIHGLHHGMILQKTTGQDAIISLDGHSPNLLDGLTSSTLTSLPRRIALCIGGIGLSTSCLIGYSIYTAAITRTTRQEEKQLSAYLNQLQPRVQKAKKLEKKISLFKDRITALKELTEEEEVPAYICMAIAEAIPENTWLTSVTIGGKSNTKEHFQAIAQNPQAYLDAPTIMQVPLSIKGKTTLPDEVGSFLEAISNALPQATLSIEFINRDHTKNAAQTKKTATPSKKPYLFSITGSIDE